MRKIAWMCVCAAAAATVCLIATPASAGSSIDYGRPPGEAGRLNDRINETVFRSPNVYRSSRQFSPLGNPFRSSRHYKKRLAASYDGYRVRTYHHGRHGSHARRHFGHIGSRRFYNRPYGYYNSYAGPIYDYATSCSSYDTQEDVERRYNERQKAEAERRQRRFDAQRRTQSTAIAAAERAAQPPATQTAVSQRVVTPDGRVKIVITSVPKEDAVDTVIAAADTADE